MILRYETNVDDALAFQKYYYDNSPAFKHQMTKYIAGSALLMYILIFALSVRDDVDAGIRAGLIGAGTAALILSPLLRYRLKRRMIKMCTEGDYKRYLGERELEIMPDGIISRSPYSETKLAWAAVEKIELTTEHTFIFVGSRMAFIIPHNRIEQGDYKTFLTELGRHYQPDQKFKMMSRQRSSTD